MGTEGGGSERKGGARYLEYEMNSGVQLQIYYLLWYFSYYSILFTIPIVKLFSEKYLVKIVKDRFVMERVLLKINKMPKKVT